MNEKVKSCVMPLGSTTETFGVHVIVLATASVVQSESFDKVTVADAVVTPPAELPEKPLRMQPLRPAQPAQTRMAVRNCLQ